MSRIVTLAQVARDAGVSVATVSRVLNPGSRRGPVNRRSAKLVLDTAKRLGYVPNYHAQAMKAGRSGCIAVILDLGREVDPDPEATALGMPYFGTIVGAIERRTREMGYDMIIVGTDEKAVALDRGILGLRQRKYDGLIVPVSGNSRSLHTLGQCAPELPIALIGELEGTDFPHVYWDEATAVTLAVKHLAELGHREFLWVGPDPACDRERRFMDAVWELGLRGSSCRFKVIDTEHFDLTQEAVELALRKRLADRRRDFTGVICFNDVTAIAVCGVFLDTGMKIPGDVSVIGFDNVLAPLGYPRLTAVSQRLYEHGRRAADLVFEMAQDEKSRERLRGTKETIPPKLVVRKSTGPAPQQITSTK